MRIAIIDLGTNTFNLLVAEIDGDGKHSKFYNDKIAVKLGEGGINKGFIAPEPFQRGLKAINEHMKIVHALHAERVLAFGTSALRNASNGRDFIEAIKKQEGIEIQIIDGNREAEYIYYGVREAVAMDDQASLILDIGGGSNEFIIANKNEILWKQSFELGAARLLEQFNPSDPITRKERSDLTGYLSLQLVPLWIEASRYGVQELIGSSGSFESLAEMIAFRFHQPDMLEGKTEYDFNLDESEVIFRDIVASTKADRLAMKGLIHMRVDMIVVSALLVELVMHTLDLKKMRLSTYSLKEGVLWSLTNEGK